MSGPYAVILLDTLYWRARRQVKVRCMLPHEWFAHLFHNFHAAWEDLFLGCDAESVAPRCARCNCLA